MHRYIASQKSKYVLILGSKQNSFIPNLKYKEIFSSNASSIHVKKIIKNNKNTKHTCVIGLKVFNKFSFVKKKILNSMPSELVIRGKGILNLNNKEKKKLINTKIKYLFAFQEIVVQSFFLYFFIINLILAEMKYEKKILKKIKHFFYLAKDFSFLGASSGLFALFYAMKKNKNSKFILSGIGLKGGQRFYNKGRKFSQNRGRS